MRLNEWAPVEIDGHEPGSVVAVPVLAPVADMVSATAAKLGFDRATFLFLAVGVGMTLIERMTPSTPVPPAPGSAEPSK